MEKLTQSEYKELLNDVGDIVRFYVNQIYDIKYDPDFYETFSEIDKEKNVKINDYNSDFTLPYRFIDRTNESICLTKNIYDDKYEDVITYYLSTSFNKRIKATINYNQIINNYKTSDEIFIEILKEYKKEEKGDIFNEGKRIEEQEVGYKGKVFAGNNESVFEYYLYKYKNNSVITLEDKDEYPSLVVSDKSKKTIQMPDYIENPAQLALEETRIKEYKGIQRVR